MVAVRSDFGDLHRIGLADAHEDEVVEDAFGRQCDIDDLGEVHLEDVSSLESGHFRIAETSPFCTICPIHWP
jgi:hypothetical protein